MDEITKKVIGQRINGALADRDVKQKDLAKAIGVTDNTVSYFVNGSRTPNTEQIIEIAKFLDVSADYLLGISSNMTTDIELKAVCEYTGLNAESVETVINIKNNNLSYYLNRFFCYDIEIKRFIEQFKNYMVYEVTDYKLKEILLKQYVKENNLTISDKDIEEKGKYALNEEHRYQYETLVMLHKTRTAFPDNSDYLTFLLHKEFSRVISDAQTTWFDDESIIDNEPSINDYLSTTKMNTDELRQWLDQKLNG